LNYEAFEKAFSRARVRRYYVASGFSEERAMQLYRCNLQICKAFHPLLGVFEVAFRNGIDAVLSKHFDDTNWIINQKTGFMSDAALIFVDKRSGKPTINQYLRREVEKAEQRLTKTGTKITSGRVIAEQSLGFWTAMFELTHYKVLKGRPIQVFTDLPSGYGRKEINEALEKIRIFRNRINHNEPICFQGESIDLTEAMLVQGTIYKLLFWMKIDVAPFFADIDTINEALEAAKQI